jgi:DNA-binding Lrp family transcriptional regulator
MTIDKKVKEQILTMLLNDSRLSFRTIANKLDISTTTVSRIVKELEKEGAILGYTALVDWRTLGYESTLCIHIGISSKADTEKVGKTIKKIESMKQVFYTTGDLTFNAYAVCKNTEEAAALIEELRRIPGVNQVISHTVLRIF